MSEIKFTEWVSEGPEQSVTVYGTSTIEAGVRIRISVDLPPNSTKQAGVDARRIIRDLVEKLVQ